LQPDEAKEDDAENCGWFRDWWDKRVEELDAGQQQSLKAAAAQAILKQLDGSPKSKNLLRFVCLILVCPGQRFQA
jgi:hypothetical protein